MYKPTFNIRRQVLVFRHFGNKGYSLFACLGREVVCSVLSVATLTYASAESVSTNPVVTDSASMTTAREMMLEEVSVTGSRAPLTKSQAARMVTVLDRAEIQQAPVQSINDLLKYAIGVDVRQRGPIGAQTDISIRGGTQDQIILLLNGINICDPQTGHNAMDLPVDLSDIVRIEVLEGPAGRIYGSSSLVGAINIVTSSRSEKNAHSLQMHAEGGSYGYAKVGGRFGFENTSFSNAVSANYARSDGYSRSKAGSLNTDFSGSKAFYQGQYMDEDIRIRWHLGIADKGFGSSTFWASPKWQADDQYEHTTKIYSAIQAETHCGRLKLMPSIYWNQNKDRYEGYRDQPEKMKYNYNRTDVYGVNLSSYFDWVAGRTAFGAEFRNEDIVSSNLGEPLHEEKGKYKYGLNRSNLSFHLEHNVLLQNFTLSAGFIAIKNTWNEMPFTLYPGIDASYRIGNHWKVYASYNESLRMPSFTELYYSVGGHKADKYLKPEELRAVEGGVKYSARGLNVKASIFHHHARNMIDWVMDTRDADPIWQSVNHTKVNTLGEEISVQGSGLRVKGFLAYCHLHQSKQEADYLQSQYSLEYLRHKVTAQLTALLTEKLEVTMGYRYQDRMGSYTTTEGEVKSYHPYSVIDAKATWKEDTYSIYIEGNNLTNHRYVDYGNVPQPGAWVIAGVKIALN